MPAKYNVSATSMTTNVFRSGVSLGNFLVRQGGHEKSNNSITYLKSEQACTQAMNAMVQRIKFLNFPQSSPTPDKGTWHIAHP